MTMLSRYILSVTAAAVICSIAKSLVPGKDTATTVTRLLCGIFLAVTVIAPLKNITIGDISDWTTDIARQADDAVAQGASYTENALAQSIKSRAEAYILDKARSLQADVTVEVTLSDESIPAPIAATISGSVSPYAKKQLQRILTEDLGIPKEDQTWI